MFEINFYEILVFNFTLLIVYFFGVKKKGNILSYLMLLGIFIGLIFPILITKWLSIDVASKMLVIILIYFTIHHLLMASLVILGGSKYSKKKGVYMLYGISKGQLFLLLLCVIFCYCVNTSYFLNLAYFS